MLWYLTISRHPSIVLSHVAFRAAAIFFYVFAYFFTDSFIVQFLVIVSFLPLQNNYPLDRS
uniref:Uncharacterized protein n=1 Tax=Parascaris equorum TaxID=6256 RepID=A0A914RQN8_PAREQ